MPHSFDMSNIRTFDQQGRKLPLELAQPTCPTTRQQVGRSGPCIALPGHAQGGAARGRGSSSTTARLARLPPGARHAFKQLISYISLSTRAPARTN